MYICIYIQSLYYIIQVHVLKSSIVMTNKFQNILILFELQPNFPSIPRIEDHKGIMCYWVTDVLTSDIPLSHATCKWNWLVPCIGFFMSQWQREQAEINTISLVNFYNTKLLIGDHVLREILLLYLLLKIKSLTVKIGKQYLTKHKNTSLSSGKLQAHKT
jgi:hypothetical protein